MSLPSTHLDLTPQDDTVNNDMNEVVKELREKIVGMEKRLQDLEKTCKNLCTERMEGEINTEVSLQCTSTNPQNSSPLLSTDNNDEGDDLSHAEETERTTTTNNEILIAICKDLLSYCNSCICTWKSVVHLGTVTM